MANELYIYTTPAGAAVTLQLDLGATLTGVPGNYNGRTDGHLIQIPTGTTPQGSTLTITAAGYETFSARGYLQPNEAGEAFFNLNDIHLAAVAVEPPPGPNPGPTPTDPLGVINAVYATGQYNLATKTGCGTFTEACAWELRLAFGDMWGHILKDPGQNQYNSHAVDALQSIYGEYTGKWDIIVSSVSSSAHPSFNDAGDSDPHKFAPAFPPGGAANDASLAASLTRLIRVLVHALGR